MLTPTGKRSDLNLLVFFIYSVLVFIFIFTTKTVFSGFQLIDDQILIGYNNQLHHDSFFFVLLHDLQNEFYLRFRPLTILNYIAISKWLYPDFFLLAMVIALEGIFTCYFFYRFARQLKCSPIVSFLFPLFILCGNQGVIFWRNCVNETSGMLLLSISLFFLAKTFTSNQFYKRNIFFFSFFLWLTTLTKESFIILVPAIIFFKVWQDVLVSDINFWNSIKANTKLIVFSSLVIIVEILIICYYKAVSDHFINYVAIDRNTFKPANLFISFYRLTVTKGYLIVIVSAIALIFLRLRFLYTWRKDLQNTFLPLSILFLLIIIPQILLYAKSLIFERYLLPGTVSCAVVIIFLEKYIQKNKKKLSLLNSLFLPLCSMLLCAQIFLMTRGAHIYTAEGFETKKVLETIMQNTKTNDTILVVALQEQNEKALSVKAYLNAAIGGNRKNIFIEPIIDSTANLSAVVKSDIISFAKDTKGIRYTDIIEKSSIACITFFQNSKDKFISRYPEFDTSSYKKTSVGSFLIFIKNRKL